MIRYVRIYIYVLMLACCCCFCCVATDAVIAVAATEITLFLDSQKWEAKSDRE